MKLRTLGVLATVFAIALSACNQAPAGTGGATKGAVKFAIELPLQGSEKAASDPIINGVKLALKQASNAAGGYTIELPQSAIYDDALNGAHDAQTGANNMSKIVADESVVAVIGPLNSSVAKAQIPVSNEGGLPQCSPANTNPDLTKGEAGKQLRKKANNYIRVVTTDDVQGPAAARYIYDVLKKTSVYIIDDTETFGKGVADAFEADFKKAGGTVTKHDGAPKTTQDYVTIMTAAASGNPQAIYFGGVTATGGARILLAAAQAGLGAIPYVGPDGINDGSATTKDSFLNLAGDKAANSYSTLAGIGTFDGKAKFDTDYKAEFGIDATGYAAQGFACAQILIDALGRAGATNPSGMAGLREALRVAMTDTTHTYKTIQGDITFNAEGDTSQRIVSIYSFDATAKDWKFETQVDYK
ncbi:MAG: branched-chain amino acid ABC transporter substrate-binding protein [Chloroflexota bacterium]